MKIIDLINKRNHPFYSLEFFPPKDPGEWPAFFAIADKLKAMAPLFVSVTCGAGGSTQAYTLEIASRLKSGPGFEPMPHLTCVGNNRENLLKDLDGFAATGLDNVLALRGDLPKDAGPDRLAGDFNHADALVRFIKRERPQFGMGVAGYPAPHPESPSFPADREHLIQKIKAGADIVVTQLFFDSREYFSLVHDLRRAGIDAPVIPGILPIQSLASIKRTLSMCGANIPGNLYLKLEAAHEKGGTEAVKETGLIYAIEQIKRLLDGGVPGVHLYTLNRAELCLQIKNEVGPL